MTSSSWMMASGRSRWKGRWSALGSVTGSYSRKYSMQASEMSITRKRASMPMLTTSCPFSSSSTKGPVKSLEGPKSPWSSEIKASVTTSTCRKSSGMAINKPSSRGSTGMHKQLGWIPAATLSSGGVKTKSWLSSPRPTYFKLSFNIVPLMGVCELLLQGKKSQPPSVNQKCQGSSGWTWDRKVSPRLSSLWCEKAKGDRTLAQSSGGLSTLQAKSSGCRGCRSQRQCMPNTHTNVPDQLWLWLLAPSLKAKNWLGQGSRLEPYLDPLQLLGSATRHSRIQIPQEKALAAIPLPHPAQKTEH